MSRNNFDPIRKAVQRAARRTLISIGQDIRDLVRDIISVRVQYVGNEIIRSDPGEAPRYEFGDLWKSITYRYTTKSGTVGEVWIFSTSNVSWFLEKGTDTMAPRPHWKTARQMAGNVKAEFNRRFKKNLAEELAALKRR